MPPERRSSGRAARPDLWRAELRGADGTTREVYAHILVNAAGPWVMEVLALGGLTTRARLRLVKGSHIVVPKLYEGEHAYLLQNDDRRVVFVMPFEHDYSLIGTTELPFSGDPAEAEITPEETLYLCRAVGRWFKAPPNPSDVVWSYARVRPLYENHARNPPPPMTSRSTASVMTATSRRIRQNRRRPRVR